MIKNIIFDLCGPIITIDCGLIDKRFHELGIVEKHPYSLLVSSGLTKEFECDEIDTPTFCNRVRELLNTSISDTDICDAWNTLITDFPQKHIELLKKVRQHYKVFLLSNSDRVNADYFVEYLNRTAGFDFMGECFDEVFFSYQLRNRKPTPEVYRHIAQKHGLIPDETLVIDDRLKHCSGAEQAGMRSHHLLKHSDIGHYFSKKGKWRKSHLILHLAWFAADVLFG